MEQEFLLKQEWAQELEHGLDEYMMRLRDSIDDEEVDQETLSGEPYCGCGTCEFREILFYISPRIMRGQAAGNIWLTDKTTTNGATNEN